MPASPDHQTFVTVAVRLGFCSPDQQARLDGLVGDPEFAARVSGDGMLSGDQLWAVYRTMERVPCLACGIWNVVTKLPIGSKVMCGGCGELVKVSSRFGAGLNPVGQRFGDWQVLGLVGEGGRGQVYRARHVKQGTKAALKLLARNLSDETEYVERFLREARVIFNLDHPNVVRIYDFGRSNKRHFLAMELLDGETITERLQRVGSLDSGTVISLARQAASGLAAIHALGVVHRDIKPDNLMIVGDSVLKLVDFGLTKGFIDSSESLRATLTKTGMAVGTPMYMAPEQCLGNPIDGRTDLYQLGLVLYTALTGRPPFDDSEATALMQKQVNTPLGPIPPGMAPPALEKLLARLTEKDPARRVASADDLLEALRGIEGPANAPPGSFASSPAELPTLEVRVDTDEEPTRARGCGALIAAIAGLASITWEVIR